MKRFLLLISISFFLSALSYANHITGGQIYYSYLGQSVNSSGAIVYSYHVTLNLYRDYNAPSNAAQLDDIAPIAIYDKSTGARVWSQGINRLTIVDLNLGFPSPCITNPPAVHYQVGYYEFDVTLPGSPAGYTVVYQRCCRIAGINNLSGSNSVGATYIADIPGTSLLATAPENNSAKFIGADTVIVCANNGFTYSFAALDKDNDQLVYSFCDAYTGGSMGNATPNPPVGPPYLSVPYASPYNNSSPLGPGVTLNTSTGLISGVAPEPGIYVVTVCVNEIRNGVVIATQRKDLQIKVGDCNVARALLDPQYITCDGYSWTFSNGGDQTLIKSYYWLFGDPASGGNDSSNLATPTHVFTDTGAFNVTLITNRFGECSDTGRTIMKVYPGFFPAFNVSGACYTNPFQFTDATSTAYGVVDSWSWGFGDPSSGTDTSHLQNPTWMYPTAGPKDVTLIVSNSKGCIKTLTQTVSVIDKPPITLAFKDTLICVPDAVQLQAGGNGIFSWAPTTNMTNSNTATPTVNPANTTWYVVNLDDSGCKNRDSVRVRVVRVVSIVARGDTTICLTDAVQLGATTDGLQFQWTPAATLNNPAVVNPIATPAATTVYRLLARIGSCTATDDVKITTVPYPYSNAGNDTMICYNTSAQLNGTYTGSSFSWSPVNYINDPNITNPVAKPPRTTSFVLTVYDIIGCPKPGRDTVMVTVLPKVKAYAGRDTSVVVGQEMQFNGSGGVSYLWSPPTGLNNIAIPNPIGIYGPEIDSVRYKLLVTDQAGCADSAFVLVKIFKTNPSVFVPTAFTPNNDGLNDVVRPIAVGIQQIKYFSIYNRWGQMVFTTTENEKGWDGKVAGRPQNSGVFVWMVSAIDYTGKPIFLKGTVALIR